MSAPRVSDVPMMDKLTNLELNHLIVEEEEPGNSTQPLSYLLSRIFRTFTIEVPDATELQFRYMMKPAAGGTGHFPDHIMKLASISYPNSKRLEMEKRIAGRTRSLRHLLVDTASSDTSQKPQTLEDIFSSFFNATCGAVAQKKRAQIMAANSGAVIRTWSSRNSTRPVKDDEVSRKPDLALLDDVEARWDTIKAACELTSQPYTPSSTIGKTLDSKAYLLLRRQPWRRFVLLFSLMNEYRELRVHIYDHAGGVVTRPIHIDKAPNRYLHILSSIVFGHLECIGYDPSISIFTKTLCPAQLENPILHPSTRQQIALNQVHGPQMDGATEGTVPNMDIDASESESDSDVKTPHSKLNLPMDPPQIEIPEDPLRQPFSEPIGRITVNDHAYDILELIFSSQGLVGRGTVCYLARRDNEEYIIKDHWVLGGKDAVLNEVDMLHEMKGVHGIPELVEYWLVEVVPGEVDKTMSYRYKVFESIKGALRDIVKIQQTAVEEWGILYRDCSLNNAMIWDDGNGGQGTLIDWEFAVHIVAGRKYAISGTGTLLFMSRSLLWQLSEAVAGRQSSQHSPLQRPPPLILHHYHDDLESLFYVFVCICIEFRGPLGVRCDLSADRSQEWLPHRWSTNTLRDTTNEKTSFFFHPNAQKLKRQFHPYFTSLLPLAKDWYELIRNKGPSSTVTFQEVIDLLEMHLDMLPKNEPSPELLFARRVIAALLQKRNANELEGNDTDSQINERHATIVLFKVRWELDLKPQERKTKRKATDSDLKAPEGQEGVVKRACAQAGSTTNQVDESQHPRRSGRPGAGKGGRDTQLEKIGAILHAPTRTNQAKGNTSLDPNIPTNPLAPEPP
ncbi:uncharacterized protein F5147DRAFT_779553 [Suillus discolor]|uniref:Fungal-type protein kinase domain-containing protein n=1 Tax=Suillus discolor TaxID=1912936 RepID=A0A9P7EVA2_9AGAM|nr:uncharacterized protein F5147DRAFT_779553 [Suillus discolor]KAG2092810.1 hypothetical protein F5147DRAFT_779553 [Suillus discolor]